MRAAFLVRNGAANQAFEIRETATPEPALHEIQIKVEGFGLNFADVMARLGFYRDAPPIPAILGYDVVGKITSLGENVSNLSVGDRVTAFSRFGGYAEYVTTDARGAASIPEDMPAGKAVALTTQYGTAYYMAAEMVQLHEGDHVLIHAAAGGVGTALVQWAVHRGCVIYGTAGSEEKLAYLKKMGVQHPINYRQLDFEEEIRKIRGDQGLDVVFDPVGGKSVKKGYKLLGPGGRIVLFGASSMTNATNIFSKIKVGLGFGFYHPVGLLQNSRSMIGINMLPIGTEKPDVLNRVFKEVVRHTKSGVFNPTVGGEFKAEQIGEAHHFLESRQSMGKIVVYW